MLLRILIGLALMTLTVITAACVPVDTCYVTRTFTYKEPIDTYSVVGYGNFSHFQGTMNISGNTFKITYSADNVVDYMKVIMNSDSYTLYNNKNYSCKNGG